MARPAKKKTNKSQRKISVNRVAKKFDYTPEERALIEKYFISSKMKPVKYKATDKNQPLEVEGDQLLAAAKITEALSVSDPELQMFFLNHVVQTFKVFQSSEGVYEKNELFGLTQIHYYLNPCCRRERTMTGFMGNTTWLEKKQKRFRLNPLF